MGIDNSTKDEGEINMATIIDNNIKGSIFEVLKKERKNDPDRMQRVFERVEKISPFITRKDK